MDKNLKIWTVIVVLFCFVIKAKAQLVNEGFENWTGNTPDAWVPYNDIPTSFFTVVSTTDVNSGNLAANIKTANAGGFWRTGKINGRFALDSIPKALKIWARPQFLNANERLRIMITVKNGAVNVAQGLGNIYGDSLSYSEYVVNIDTLPGHQYTCDSILIELKFLDANGQITNPNPNSKIFVDDLSLPEFYTDLTVNIFDAQKVKSLPVLIPNPASEGESILVKAFEEIESVSVTDINGKEVLSELRPSRLTNGKYQLNTRGWLPGMYTVQINDGVKITSVQLVITR